MDLNQILLWIHIAAAGIWLGAGLMQSVAPPAIAGHGNQALAGWFRASTTFGRRIYMPVSILVLVTGVWMVLRIEAYGFGTRFVTVGFAAVIISVLLGLRVLTPAAEKAADAIDSGDEAGVKSATKRMSTWGTVDLLILLLTMLVMVIRWS